MEKLVGTTVALSDFWHVNLSGFSAALVVTSSAQLSEFYPEELSFKSFRSKYLKPQDDIEVARDSRLYVAILLSNPSGVDSAPRVIADIALQNEEAVILAKTGIPIATGQKRFRKDYMVIGEQVVGIGIDSEMKPGSLKLEALIRDEVSGATFTLKRNIRVLDDRTVSDTNGGKDEKP